jgi:TrmH family RNA methyltransferase
MTTIASHHNQHLKELRRLQGKRERERTGTFVAEGEDLVAAATRAGRRLVAGYREAGSGLGGEGFLDVERDALVRVSALGSGTRVIGVYEQRWGEPLGPLCVYLHGVGDPGNVGTVLRSAEAFAAASVVLGPGCADPHSAKAVRASMGAIFSVPLAHAAGTADLPGTLLALDTRGDRDLADVCAELEGPVTLLVGAEREGLPREMLASAAHVARIEIASESLNAAMAATVALYELTRSSQAAGQISRVRSS